VARRAALPRGAAPATAQEATAELLADLLGADASVRELAARIASRTRGNRSSSRKSCSRSPSRARSPARAGAYRRVREPNELSIPATVQAVLAARIDRLAEQEKDVLQQAAVIGKDSRCRCSAHVTGESALEVEGLLYRLISAQFVYEQALFPRPSTRFKHPLTQEVAFTRTLERRSKTHAAVARAAPETAPKSRPIATLVAHHWENAGDLLEARAGRGSAEWRSSEPQRGVRHWKEGS